MDWLREGLAKLLTQTPQDSVTESLLVVFFDSPMVYRYHKGRIYDKPLTNALDPQLLACFEQQQHARILHAETMRSPYSNTPFLHQYLHVYALPQGLLLLQQANYEEAFAAMDLLLTAISLLLSQRELQLQTQTYRAWLTTAGMNRTQGALEHQGEFFTPYPAPVFVANAHGFLPYHALMLSLREPYSVLEVRVNVSSERLFEVHPTWYFHRGLYYAQLPTTDKRVINRLVNDVIKHYSAPFETANLSVARSTDPLPLEDVLDSLRDQAPLYFSGAIPTILDDVTVAMATTKRHKLRNHVNQWVADLFVPPTMTIACELSWLTNLLKTPPPRTRYVQMSEALANHPDTVAYFNHHRMGALWTRTCVVANHLSGALATYLQEKNAIIGSRDWNTLMTASIDVFLFDHVANQDDETMLDYLYYRQMTDGLTVIFPIRNQQDALWLINHNVGLFYKEDVHE